VTVPSHEPAASVRIQSVDRAVDLLLAVAAALAARGATDEAAAMSAEAALLAREER